MILTFNDKKVIFKIAKEICLEREMSEEETIVMEKLFDSSNDYEQEELMNISSVVCGDIMVRKNLNRNI